MTIKHRPKVGELLECDFGKWSEPESVNGHIPPEMRKRRLVVVLNGDLDGQSAVVVPISSKKAYGRLATYHQYINPDLIQETIFYEKIDRWAKAEHCRFVSTKRLHYIFDNNQKLNQRLPNELITEIQKKILIAVSGKRIFDEMERKINELEERSKDVLKKTN